jgi:hypothetical protein
LHEAGNLLWRHAEDVTRPVASSVVVQREYQAEATWVSGLYQ